jgi:hypothetical protein
MIELPRKKNTWKMKMFSTFIKFHAACQVMWDQAQREKKIIRFFLFLFLGSATEILALCSSRWEILVFLLPLLYTCCIYRKKKKKKRDRGRMKREWEEKKKERKRIPIFFYLGVERRPRVKLVSVDVAPSTGEQHASPVPLDYLLKKIYLLMFKNFPFPSGSAY